MPSPLWSYVSPGIPDHLFDRLPGIPLTKREVRVLLISFLRLKPDSVLWDIGAGTGTLTVEAGLLCPAGRVIAIERDEDVATLIRQNCDRFGVQNVEIIEGSAPQCLQMLAPPDCVYVGGGRPIKAILKAVFARLQPNGRLVATATKSRDALRDF